MKNSIILLLILLLFFAGTGEQLAQDKMYVKERNGTQTVISLSGIRKLNFPGGSLAITDTNAGTQNYPVSDIRFFSFTNYFTGIPEPVPIQSGMPGLFPNPVNSTLYIETTEEPDGLTVEILDLQGRVLQTHFSQNGKTSLDVSGMEPGIYFTRIQIKSKIFVGKFIKN